MVIFSHQPDHIRSSNSCPVFFTSESRADGVTPRFQAALGRLQWSEISNVFLWIFTMDCQFLHLRHQLCTLWLCQNSYWIACHRNSWFTHTTWWFSIVMWKFTRGYSPCILQVKSPIFMAKKNHPWPPLKSQRDPMRTPDPRKLRQGFSVQFLPQLV